MFEYIQIGLVIHLPIVMRLSQEMNELLTIALCVL